LVFVDAQAAYVGGRERGEREEQDGTEEAAAAIGSGAEGRATSGVDAGGNGFCDTDVPVDRG
jgi:hypothetical protein